MSNPSLYIHIPFCHSKCFYCSFAVSIGQEVRIDRYIECLGVEAKKYKGTKLETIYFGGGTPSYLNKKQFRRLLDLIEHNFQFKKSIEITIEANPEDVQDSLFKELKEWGVNRISLGVQSFNEKYLKYLGRNHSVKSAEEAYHKIKRVGFRNVSVDLMFSFPEQSVDELNKDVDALLKLNCDHVSLYSLTIEENSKFFTKKVRLADTDRQADDYVLIVDRLDQAGFKQYEISNFAKDGKESKHNTRYWLGEDYIGLGIGAHSHRRGQRYWNGSNLFEYIKKIESNESAAAGNETLSGIEQLMERILFGLRMNDGVNLKELERNLGVELTEDRKKMLQDLIDQGFLVVEGDLVKTTLEGKLVLDELSVKLI